MRILLLISLLLTGCLQAQIRSVSVNTNGLVVAPTNFWPANSNALNAVVSPSAGSGFTIAGRGLVDSGDTIHFGQSAAYTTGLLPYASATNGIGFAANLFWNPATDRLTVGAPIAGSSTLHVATTEGIQYGTSGELNRLFSDGSGNVVMQFGGTIGFNNVSFILRGISGASPFDVWSVRNGNIFDVYGNFRPLLIGPSARIIGTDTSTNLVAVTLVNSDIPSEITRTKLEVGPADAIIINGADGLLSSETTLGAARFPALTGDVTTPGGSLATTITNLAKSKISTTGTWAASDIPSLDASKIGSGTLDTNRLPTLVKDLGALTGTTGDIYYYDGTHLNRLAATTAGFVLTANGAGVAPSYTELSSGTTVSVNATNVTTPNIQDSATVTWAKSGSNLIATASGVGGGSVTSVGLSLPSIFSVSGSPVTTSGTLTGTLATATANTVFAGPTSGGSATPVFRALVSGDIPNNAIPTNGSAYSVVGGSAVATDNWIALTNAYLAAKSATPHGLPLLTNNRFTIVLLPDVYDAGANTLLLDGSYIDLIGMSPNSGQIATINTSTTNDFGGVLLRGSGVVISMPASVGAAQEDMMLANMTISSSAGVTFSPGAGGTGDRFQMRNVFIHRDTLTAAAMADVVYRGYFEHVVCINDYAWGAGATGSADGQFWYCVGGDYAWSGYNGVSDGKFYYCRGGRTGQPAFGAIGASGTYYYCESTGAGFGNGGTFSGTAAYCSAHAGAGFGGSGGTMSGNVIACYTSAAFAPATISGTIIDSSLGGKWYHGGAAAVGGVVTATNAVLTGTTLTLNTTNTAATASRFATFDSAKVLSSSGASADLAATLTDETGTGAAVFGTSPSLTNTVTITRDAIGAVQTNVLLLVNNTAAATNAQQYPPGIILRGSGFGTSAGGSVQQMDWLIDSSITQGSSPSENLVFSSSINASPFAARLTLTSAGGLTISALNATAGAFTGALTTTSTLGITGVSTLQTNVFVGGTIQSTNGFSSIDSTAAAAIDPSGYTNTLGKLCRVWFSGTAITYTMKDAANSPYWTNSVAITGDKDLILQSSEAVTISGTSVTGVRKPL